MYKFYKSCVDLNEKDLIEFETTDENAIKITAEQFKKCIGKENYQSLESNLGYDNVISLNLANDFATSFYKSTFKQLDCVYLVHSAIEYLFLK